MGTPSNQALVFSLDAERYALPALDVTKIVDLGPLSTLPRLPAAVLGITHHRGRITTVVDLRAVVQGKPTVVAAGAQLMLVERAGRSVGFLCRSVEEIIPLDPAGGTPPLKTGGFVTRIHVHRDRAVHLLQTDSLLGWVDKTCQLEVPFHPLRAASPATSTGPFVPLP